MARNDTGLATGQAMAGKPEEGLWETVKVIIQALLIAFVVRTFLFQPFVIPSPSMYPTLRVGDYIFVSKLSYGYGKYSFNFAPGWGGSTWFECCPIDFPGRKILADNPERGDVAVFKYPGDLKTDYIKRVIGLPGDRIQMRDGVLYINDVAVKKERVEDYVDTDMGGPGGGAPVKQYQETLPNGVTYRVLDLNPDGDKDNTEVYTVPEDHYFMMGDNRDNSQDSRFLDKVGYVPIENYMGRADIIFFSISQDQPFWHFWNWPFAIRWGRFFNMLW